MTQYKVSQFTVSLPVEQTNGELLAIYHTLTEAFILLPATQWNTGAPEMTTSLVSQGILVKDEVDESIVFHQWRQRYIHDFSTLRAKVLVTRQCNNRCTYCIIDPEAGVMSNETARAMDAFYLEQIKRRHPLQVRDDYLGGEPLLNLGVIVKSATRRFYFCQGRGIDYRFSITTNGTRLAPHIVRRLKAVGLAAVRVSMAGPEEIHDKLRPLKNGAGTYAAILKNLASISGMVDLFIECQYDAGSDDYQRIPEMLEDFKHQRILVADITFTPILARRGTDSFCAGMGSVEKYQFLSHQARQYGISTHSAPPSNACMTDFRSHYVIDTDGSLIPCPSLQGGERTYGTVTAGIDFVTEAQLLERRWPEKCVQRCELLPICMGGCRLQALIRHGDFNGIDCHYNTYRQLLDAYICDSAASALDHQIEPESHVTCNI